MRIYNSGGGGGGDNTSSSETLGGGGGRKNYKSLDSPGHNFIRAKASGKKSQKKKSKKQISKKNIRYLEGLGLKVKQNRK